LTIKIKIANLLTNMALKNLIKTLILIPALLISVACNFKKSNIANIDYQNLQTLCVNRLTDVVVHDIFNPPVASRIYAYSNLAYYEALRYKNKDAISITQKMNGFILMPKPMVGKNYNYNLAAVKAFFKVAKLLTFSKDSLIETENKLLSKFKAELTDDIYINSIAFGDTIAATILKRSANDNYKKTRGMSKYTVSSNSGYWQPTPPDYFDAIEPHWDIIKPFMLDSVSQFAPPPPPLYSLNPKSLYYKELMETYNFVKFKTLQQDTIAQYWDDNAFVTQHDGHLTYASKKTTPPGHWLGIVSILSKQQNTNEFVTAKAYALASAAMFDGFITCWIEKFKTKTIRPITVIQENLDRYWKPILQTPPFPEYISGHSVISSAAATILTHIYGDNLTFTDTTEMKYLGLKRNFNSINMAATEVGMSRLYGGIHYRSAINEGAKQGILIGNLYINKIN